MSEWSNELVLKTSVGYAYRGFESLSLRQILRRKKLNIEIGSSK
jgi:hypothetical protein